MIAIPIKPLPHFAGLQLPQHATRGSAGLDVQAAVDHPITLRPGERVLVPTGLSLALPLGYEAQIRPRSGLAYQHGLTVLNSPGTIDSDFRGELKVLLVNQGGDPVTINRGDRVAQLVLARTLQITWQPTDELPETVRSVGGFGSTGTAGATP